MLLGCRAFYGVGPLHEFTCFYVFTFSIPTNRPGSVQGYLFLAQFLKAYFPCCMKFREFLAWKGDLSAGPDIIEKDREAVRDEVT